MESNVSGKSAYNSEGHTGGTIIAGAAWDLRQRLMTRLGNVNGALYADRLMFEALQQMATMPRDYYFSDPQESNFLSSLYIAADDNNNLMDGVPYFFDMQRAFANHNLLHVVLNSRTAMTSPQIPSERTRGEISISTRVSFGQTISGREAWSTWGTSARRRSTRSPFPLRAIHDSAWRQPSTAPMCLWRSRVRGCPTSSSGCSRSMRPGRRP